MKRFIIPASLVVIAVIGFFLCAAAWAQGVLPVTAPQTQQQWWQALLLALATAAVPVVAAMLVDLIKVLAKKFRLQIDATKLDKIAEFALGYVEQKIVRVAKLEGNPTPAAAAMAKAVELAITKAKEVGYPEQTEAWWTAFLESKLGAGGTPAGEPPAPVKPAA